MILAPVSKPLLESARNVSVFSLHNKEQKSNPELLTFGTHDGTFHCDEVVALSLLQLHQDYAGKIQILRTRNLDELNKCHTVVDVGAVYDHATRRYDHHQRGFLEFFPEFETKLSSAGLVYLHYGKEIIANCIKQMTGDEADASLVDICYKKLYKNFIEHIDGIDNGVSLVNDDGTKKIKLNYHVSSHLSHRLGTLNLTWKEENDFKAQGLNNADVINERFTHALSVATEEFLKGLEDIVLSWYPARKYVLEAVEKRFEVDASGRVIFLDTLCPWKEHLFDIEKELNIEEDKSILYALFQDTNDKSFRICAVPVEPGSFSSRKALPEPWRGLRDEELSTKTGVPAGVFIHAGGFIGGNRTKEGAIALAKQAVEF